MENEKNILDHLKPTKIGVPNDAYFENMALNIIQDQRVRVVPFYKKPYFWMSAAAAITIFGFLIVKLSTQPTNSTQSNEIAFNDIKQEEITAYINENIDEFDIELLSESLSNELIDINNNDQYLRTASHESFEVMMESISKDDIMKYLQNEWMDIEELEDAEESYI